MYTMYLHWNFHTSSRLKFGDGINMRTILTNFTVRCDYNLLLIRPEKWTLNFILWNFHTCSRLKSGDGINMRTNPKAKEVTQSAVIIILLALKLANILSFYHDFFLFLDWFLDVLDFWIDFVFFSSKMDSNAIML